MFYVAIPIIGKQFVGNPTTLSRTITPHASEPSAMPTTIIVRSHHARAVDAKQRRVHLCALNDSRVDAPLILVGATKRIRARSSLSRIAGGTNSLRSEAA
jgi:hypothetical protein